MKIRKDVEKVLNLPQEEGTVSNTSLEIITDTNDEAVVPANINDDFERAHANLLETLDVGKDLLDHMARVAKERETARDFEVVGNLLKQYSDINQLLIDLHKQKKNVTEENDSRDNTYIDKAVFVGSAADVRKEIKKLTNSRKRKNDSSK